LTGKGDERGYLQLGGVEFLGFLSIRRSIQGHRGGPGRAGFAKVELGKKMGRKGSVEGGSVKVGG